MWLQQEEERAIEMPAEWGGIIPPQVFVDEAVRVVDSAASVGLTLRVMGGVAIRLHTSDQTDLMRRMARLGEGRQEYTDLDFVAYRRDREKVRPLMESLGYGKRRATLSTAASERQIYFHPQGWFFVDVFFDKLLVANHPLDFRRRLEIDSPTISLTDLLLEKLQIVNMGGKDLKDAVLLLAGHEASQGHAQEAFDADYLARILSRDWGFWYTVKSNLTGLRESLPDLDFVSEDERRDIGQRIDTLLDRVEGAPKSLKWKARAKIGTRVRWYEPVETMDTTAGFGIWRLREEPATGDE